MHIVDVLKDFPIFQMRLVSKIGMKWNQDAIINLKVM